MQEIAIRLQFTTKALASYRSQVPIVMGVQGPQIVDPLTELLQSIERHQITLTERETQIFLKLCPDDYFDTCVAVVHESDRWSESDDAQLLNRPKYCHATFNDDIIKELTQSNVPELASLLMWMKLHRELGWQVLGLHKLSIQGNTITHGALLLSLSEYIFDKWAVRNNE